MIRSVLASRQLFLLAFILTVPSACVFSTGNRGEQHEESYSWSGLVPQGQAVAVRGISGSVVTTPSADDSVRISTRVVWRGRASNSGINLQTSQDSHGVLICGNFDNSLECGRGGSGGRLNFGGKRSSKRQKVHFEVEIPAGVELDVFLMDGDVRASASAPIKVRTLNGNLTLATAVGPVRGETMNGSVDIRMMSLIGTDSVIAKTMNGAVYVYLPQEPDVQIEMETGNGRMTADFPIGLERVPNPRKIQASLGAATTPLIMRTMNGLISLRQLDSLGRSAQ